MLRMLKSVPFVFVVACAGPQVPTAFAPGSAASPATPAPQRSSVASVLVPKDPLEAPACADEQGSPAQCPEVEGGHDHSGHGQPAARQGDQAGGHDHHGGHAQPSGDKKPAAADAPARPAADETHDHSRHKKATDAEKPQDQDAAEAAPKPAKPAEHHHHH